MSSLLVEVATYVALIWQALGNSIRRMFVVYGMSKVLLLSLNCIIKNVHMYVQYILTVISVSTFAYETHNIIAKFDFNK